ncbi:hypothetical [Yersinia pestis KIM10+]|uniref:Uncharacterized protein n=1 Tax=Yersinia pestis TaxID=632 RepID=Q8CK87_YERPE|nr:hypothetical [Yersinia pestis KIM10+]
MLSLHHRLSYKGGSDRQFRCSKLKCFTCSFFRNTSHFKQYFSWLDQGNPILHVTLTFTHTHFERLLSDRFVREYTDPDLTLTLNCTCHRTTGCFDLTSRQAATATSFQAELTEANIRTLRKATVTAFVHLTEFCTLWL